MEEGKLYLVVSSPSMKDKPVQIRPWCLGDSDFVLDGSQPLDPRKTIFVGGVPRPLKARKNCFKLIVCSLFFLNVSFLTC
jgi:cytoplasmic polyadenylation element-binding protein